MQPGLQYIDRKKEIFLTNIQNMVITADIGCTGFTAQTTAIYTKLLQLPTDLLILNGDLVSIGNSENFEQFKSLTHSLAKTPIFTTCGNHDIPMYAKYLGESNYALIINHEFMFLMFNNSQKISTSSLEFMQKMLIKHQDKKIFLVFHIPPPNNLYPDFAMWADKWQPIKKVIDPYVQNIQCVFSGHLHGCCEYQKDGLDVYVSGEGGAVLHADFKNQTTYQVLNLIFQDKQVKIKKIKIKPEVKK
jgi:hypothetical protein